MENSTMVIFTVINITPNPTAPTNNPPIPPFININKLKLIYKIVSIPDSGNNTVLGLLREHQGKSGKKSIKEKIMKIGKYYINLLNTYPFYKDFESIYTGVLSDFEKIIEDKGRVLKEKVIDFIDSNNATTLIGTVDFEKFTKIRDPNQPYYICDKNQESILRQSEYFNEIAEKLEDEQLED
jgi:hypothetical protein